MPDLDLAGRRAAVAGGRLPSSHASLPQRTPSPQPVSSRQSAVQPSQLTVLPSSHSSPASCDAVAAHRNALALGGARRSRRIAFLAAGGVDRAVAALLADLDRAGRRAAVAVVGVAVVARLGAAAHAVAAAGLGAAIGGAAVAADGVAVVAVFAELHDAVAAAAFAVAQLQLDDAARSRQSGSICVASEVQVHTLPSSSNSISRVKSTGVGRSGRR